LTIFALIVKFLPVLLAPGVLIIFSLISAYVFKFSLPRTGIVFDYMVFTVYILIALVLGGAI